jgi:hypothetical protein
MVAFEDLADNVERLIYAKLALAMVSENCNHIVELARKRRKDVDSVWRDVCWTAGQHACTIPPAVMAFRMDDPPTPRNPMDQT